MANPDSNTTIRQHDDGNISINNERTQVFEEEDFIQVYRDNLQNYGNLLNQLEQVKDQREELIEENEDELHVLDYILKNEGSHEEYVPDNLQNSLDEETFQVHQQLTQIKEQIEQLESQKTRLEEQLHEMSEMATMLDDDVEEFTPRQ